MKAGTIQRFKLALESINPFALPLSILPGVLVFAISGQSDAGSIKCCVAMLVSVGLIHATGNLINDIFDFNFGLDSKSNIKGARPGKLLARGILKTKDLWVHLVICQILLAISGGYLIFEFGWKVIYFGLFGLLLGYTYTGYPFKLKYRALGEVVIFLAFGPGLMLPAGYFLNAVLDLSFVLISVSVGMMTTSILISNNIRDRLADKSAGARTLAGFYDGIIAKWLLWIFIAEGLLLPWWLAANNSAPRLLLFSPVFSLLYMPILWEVFFKKTNSISQNVDVKMAKVQSVWMLFLCFSYLLK